MIVIKDENIKKIKWFIPLDDMDVLFKSLVYYNIKYYIFSETDEIKEVLKRNKINYSIEKNDISKYI